MKQLYGAFGLFGIMIPQGKMSSNLSAFSIEL
jgi:hypothetical protein